MSHKFFAAMLLCIGLGLSAVSGLSEDNRFELRKCGKPPVVDGLLSPGEYDDGVRLENSFIQMFSFAKCAQSVSIYVARDDKNLYVCYINPLRPGEYPKSNVFIKDAVMICTDPSVELYVQPPMKPGGIPEYYQWIGNARGAYWDSHFMPTIGQAISGWNGHWQYRTSVTDTTWISELSVPLTDFVDVADIKDGLEIGLEFARDGGFRPQSYTCSFHNIAAHARIVFKDDAPALWAKSFGDFPGQKFNPVLEIRSPDRDADVTGLFEVLADRPNPKTGEWPVLKTETKQAQIAKGAKADIGVDIPLEKNQVGRARITLKEKDGSILFLRAYSFEAKPLEPAEFKPVKVKPLETSGYWAPSYGKVHVLADIYELKHPGKVIVKIDVFGPDQKKLGSGIVTDFNFGGGSANIDLQGAMKAGTYTVRSVAVDDSGKELAKDEFTYERKIYDWENSKLGYSDEVITPWMPVKAAKDSVEVWGRKYRFGPLGLPAAIESTQPEPTRGAQTRPLLSRPVELSAVSNGQPLPFTGSGTSLVEGKPTGATYAASGKGGTLLYTMTGQMDFDGYYRIDLSIRPTTPTTLENVSIDVPMPSEIVHLLHSVGEQMRANHTSTALPEKDGLLWDSKTSARNALVEGNFLPYLWIGDEDRGMAWMANNDRSWILDFDKPCLEVVRKGAETVMRIHLLNKPCVVINPIEASFSLQATPIRPRPAGGAWRKCYNFSTEFWGSSRGRGGGWGNFPYDPKAVSDYAKGWYKERPTGRLFTYECFKEEDMNQPDFRDFMGEWMVLPIYKEKTPVRSFTDWTLKCYSWWYTECKVVGHYFDNSFPNPNMNLINGTGWLDENGRVRAGYSMFEAREFMKRVATFLRTLPENKDQIVKIHSHMTDSATVSSIGWADCWFDGESGGYVAAGIKDPDAVDRWGHDTGLGSLRSTAIGRQYGLIPSWCTHYPEFGTVFGLHEIGWEPDTFRNLLGSGTRNNLDMLSEKLEFMPYWDTRKWYEIAKGGRIKCSAWMLDGAARIQVSNLDEKDADVGLKLDLKQLKVPDDCEISLETDGTVIPHDKGTIASLPIKRHKFEILLLAKKGFFDTGPVKDIAALNTGTRIPELCDDFSSLKPAWEQSYNSTPGYGPKTNVASFEPYYGALRIHTAGGYANVSRDLNQDNISVRIRAYTPAGRQCGTPVQTHPMGAVYWGKGRHIKCVMTNPWNNDGTKTEMFFLVSDGGKEQSFPCPKPGLAPWMRFDLADQNVDCYAAVDGKSWQKIASVPRGTEAGKGFAGTPSKLILGTGFDTPGTPNDLLRNDSPGIDDSYSFFDELIVEELGK